MTPQAPSWPLVRGWRLVPRRGASPLWLIGLAVAVAVFVVGLLIRPNDPGVVRHPDGVTIVLLGVACATLVMAGSRPVGAWAAALVIGVVDTVQATALSMAAVPAIIALFAIAVLRDVRITVAATTATIMVYGLCVVSLNASWLSRASTLGAWSLAVAAIGVAVRAQRAALQAARERALQAEATREEEAQRRVVDERLRIARELHDVIAHHAWVINVQSGVAGHLMTTQPDQASAALMTVRDASRTVVREMGQLVELQRSTEQGRVVEPSPGLDQLDELVTAIRNAGLALDFEVVGRPAQRPPGRRPHRLPRGPGGDHQRAQARDGQSRTARRVRRRAHRDRRPQPGRAGRRHRAWPRAGSHLARAARHARAPDRRRGLALSRAGRPSSARAARRDPLERT